MANTEQYLASILGAAGSDKNEIEVRRGNPRLTLFTLYLENHNRGVHRYQDNFTLLYALSGQLLVKAAGKEINLKSGNVLVIDAGQSYQVLRQTKGTVLAKLKFADLDFSRFTGLLHPSSGPENSLLDNLLSSVKTEKCCLIKTSPVMRPAQLLDQILGEYLAKSMFTVDLIHSLLTQFLIVSLREGRFTSSGHLSQARFAGSALDRYIDDHFTDINLTMAARYFGFNSNYFSNLVKKETGKSFVQHVDDRRMQEARQLLAQPDVSLKEIIRRVGFSSKSFFYKKFNQYYGMTPAAMRAELFRQANINLK